jgi:hypothetical protein
VWGGGGGAWQSLAVLAPEAAVLAAALGVVSASQQCCCSQCLLNPWGLTIKPLCTPPRRDVFDAVVCFEEKVMEQVVEGEAEGERARVDAEPCAIRRGAAALATLCCERLPLSARVRAGAAAAAVTALPDLVSRPQRLMKPVLIINIVSEAGFRVLNGDMETTQGFERAPVRFRACCKLCRVLTA